MPAIVIGLVLFVAANILWTVTLRWWNRGRAIERIRSLWGSPHERIYSGRDASLYHTLKAERDAGRTIDDQTWADLYLDTVFRLLDHTRGRVGSQVLYQLLRTPSQDAGEIGRRARLIDLFTADAALREKMQEALETLESDDAGLLPNLFYRPMPARPAAYLIYPMLSLGSLAAIVYVLQHPLNWPYLIPFVLANVLAAHQYQSQIQPWIQPLRVLSTLVIVARKLEQWSDEKADPDLQHITAPLREQRDALRMLDGKTRWLLWDRNTINGVLGYVVEYLNMILLLDVNAFVFSVEAVRTQQPLIQTLFEIVGTLDALIAVASYRHRLPGYCVPVFLEPGKRLRIEGALHPLLPGGVVNSLAIEECGILVTGSNMSGKTTFIRTVAVNAVLAQTVATCLATRYEAPLLQVRSSIGRTDSLSEGKSYYMAEVEKIGDFLADAAEASPHLFVIDEIFRGTNTTERVAASKAVLDALNRPDGPHIVLVSTHDIELAFLLQTRWDRYHFQESVSEGELDFDYRIRPGLCTARNALRLLAARDYPAAVVADAEVTAAQIDVSGKQERKYP